jgi:chitinase
MLLSIKSLLFLNLSLLSLHYSSVSAGSLRTFALKGGISAADEDDDYVCSAKKGCKIGCCGAL